MKSAWSIAIIIAVITAIPCIYSNYVQKRSAELIGRDIKDAEYHIHWFLILLTFIGVGMSLAFMGFAIKISRDLGGLIFFGGISVGFFVIGLIGIYECFKSKVKFEGDFLFYYTGFKTITVELKHVKNAWASTGFIVIDVGTIPRIVIPQYFSKSYEIVTRLKDQAIINSEKTGVLRKNLSDSQSQ
jgi:hypothetical protein